MASADDYLRDLEAAARRMYPGRDDIEAIRDPEGYYSVRVGDDYWRLPEDGVGLIVTRYDGDLAHVVKLDDDFQEVGAWTVRLGGDPGMN